MNERKFIQEFLDETGGGYPFMEESFCRHKETNAFYASLEKVMQEAEHIRLDNYTPLEECIMYYYEMELLTKEPKPNLYIRIRQEYRKFQQKQISAFTYYLFLIQTALDNKIQANKQMYDSIYRIYGHLCMKYGFLKKISYWNNYDSIQSGYAENDEEEKTKMRIRNRDIKSQIRTIQTYIGNQQFILPFANNRELLENCTKHILYYSLKFLVREELYNLYPDKNRSKQPKLITWLNIFFHDRGNYSFEESSAENMPVYDKKDFFREYAFPCNCRMIERIEKNSQKAIYVIGKELLLDNCEVAQTDFDLFADESLFYFVVTAYTEDFPKQFFQLRTDSEKEQFRESVEILLTCAEKILTDIDKAYMYFNDVTGSEDEINTQKEENIQKKGKMK